MPANILILQIKPTSILQTAVDLNVTLWCMHGAAHGLGLQAYMCDLGINQPLIFESDNSSAKAFASRRSLGKQRDVQNTLLTWLQKTVFVIKKVPTSVTS